MEEQVLQLAPIVGSSGALLLVGFLVWLRYADKRNGNGNSDHDALIRLSTLIEGLREDVAEIKKDMRVLRER